MSAVEAPGSADGGAGDTLEGVDRRSEDGGEDSSRVERALPASHSLAENRRENDMRYQKLLQEPRRVREEQNKTLLEFAHVKFESAEFGRSQADHQEKMGDLQEQLLAEEEKTHHLASQVDALNDRISCMTVEDSDAHLRSCWSLALMRDEHKAAMASKADRNYVDNMAVAFNTRAAKIEAYAAQEAQQSKAADDEIKEEQANIKEEQAKIKEELAFLQQSTISLQQSKIITLESELINTKQQLVDCEQTIAQQAETLKGFRNEYEAMKEEQAKLKEAIVELGRRTHS